MYGEEDIPIAAFPASLFFSSPCFSTCMGRTSEPNHPDRRSGTHLARHLPGDYGADINQGLRPSMRIAGNIPALAPQVMENMGLTLGSGTGRGSTIIIFDS